MDSSVPDVRGVHLLGSFPASYTTEQAFKEASERYPGRVKRFPDGEPEKRNQFMAFQYEAFLSAPQVLAKAMGQPGQDISQEEVKKIVDGMPDLETQYDTYAIESYATFRKLRHDGVVPHGSKFLVGLASVVCSLQLVDPSFRVAIEPKYHDAMVRTIQHIQKEIPHEDLAIQLDIPCDIAYIEGGTFFGEPWFSPVKEGVLDRLLPLLNIIEKDVELGIHFCYGDMGHVHWKEPKDTSIIVDLALSILPKLNRPLTFAHLPVPKNRDDLAYFEPLKQLEEVRGDSFELFLGLVHYDDEEGTKRRITTAGKIVKNFGVATECGFGRTPAEHIPSISAISTAVSQPWK